MMAILNVPGMLFGWIGIVLNHTPTANAIGFDPIWFAMSFIASIQIYFLLPFFVYPIFYPKAIAPLGITTVDFYRGAVPFTGF